MDEATREHVERMAARYGEYDQVHARALRAVLAALTAVEAERDHLRQLLQTHARHRACCAEHLTSGRLSCDCGLTEALEG